MMSMDADWPSSTPTWAPRSRTEGRKGKVKEGRTEDGRDRTPLRSAPNPDRSETISQGAKKTPSPERASQFQADNSLSAEASSLNILVCEARRASFDDSVESHVGVGLR